MPGNNAARTQQAVVQRKTPGAGPCLVGEDNGPDIVEIRLHKLNRSVKVGDIVFTDAEEYRNEWWWNWPGVVREAPETEDHVVVEFMGFAQMVTRRRKFDRQILKVVDDDVFKARLDRVLRYIRLPTDNLPPEVPLPQKRTQLKRTAEEEAETDIPEE